ncbi:hypothetical protein MDA_GLEAN10012813 [Myotis davidii]|uniref:Uncharacterized protein n=1 Tax=Myotis davidii TaxID=225400 RepID=L5LJB2_MYODS|nr:hypothetical protein MDA_GLEAN10012813 [Myotis davidii]
MLCMYEAPGSIPGISITLFFSFFFCSSLKRLPRCGHNRCSSSCHHLEVRFPPQWRSVLPQAWNVPEVLLLEEANGSNSQDNVEKAEQA